MTTQQLIKTALATVIIVIGGFINIQLVYIPMTMQVMAILLVAGIFGKKVATYSAIVYMLLGLIGVPVFAKGGGIWYIFEKSFGYIVGFIFAAWVIGYIIEKMKKNVINIFLADIIGVAIIYIFGLIYFYFIANIYTNMNMPISKILYYGFLITIPGDILSCIFGAIIVSLVIKYFSKYIK